MGPWNCPGPALPGDIPLKSSLAPESVLAPAYALFPSRMLSSPTGPPRTPSVQQLEDEKPGVGRGSDWDTRGSRLHLTVAFPLSSGENTDWHSILPETLDNTNSYYGTQ